MSSPSALVVRQGGGDARRVIAMAAVVLALLGSGSALLAIAVPHEYRLGGGAVFGVGTGLLALTLGMRHAFDADHIAAIDNTTRRLMSGPRRPLGVGFFFSLGHSSVVFAMAVLLGFGLRAVDAAVKNDGSLLHTITGIVGTTVSGVFLLLIAALNVVVLIGIFRAFRGLRDGRFDEAELESQLEKRGLIYRVLGRVARRVDRPWKMYPVGVLFGLGFDTATEISLLVLAGASAVSGAPWWAVISLPLLFAGGMALLDTADGVLMSAAYGWAFLKPTRKLYYNAVITALSIVIAVGIGAIEIVGLVGGELGLGGPFWSWIENVDLNLAGFVVVGALVVTWLVAIVVWRLGRFEDRFDPASP